MTSSCMWRHYACDVIICDNFIRYVFEITKVQTENNISQRIDKFAWCCKGLLGLMTSSSFSWLYNLKIFIFKNLTKNSLNQQILLINRFLDRGQIPLHPCKNSPVNMGLKWSKHLIACRKILNIDFIRKIEAQEKRVGCSEFVKYPSLLPDVVSLFPPPPHISS